MLNLLRNLWLPWCSGRGGRKFESCHSDQFFQWHGFSRDPHPDSYPDRNAPETDAGDGAEDDEQNEEAFQAEARRLGLMGDLPPTADGA